MSEVCGQCNGFWSREQGTADLGTGGSVRSVQWFSQLCGQCNGFLNCAASATVF
ncbi:MAG: hypothetical protein F6K55_45550 [Moorea sp. SIO4A3]|nr:hypothetical protein [Moorena sp. SIO4A3]